MKQNRTLWLVIVFPLGGAYGADGFHPVSIQSEIKGTQPMTGLVFWSTSEHRTSPAMPDLVALPFGICDDTFQRAGKPGYNRTGGEFFGRNRWQRAPEGGEQLIDSADFARMIGEPWRRQASDFHIKPMTKTILIFPPVLIGASAVAQVQKPQPNNQ